MLGTEIGSAAPISMTEHRSVRPKTTNAGSIRSPSHGVLFPAAGIRSQATRAMASVDEYLIRRGDGIVLLFTPPFDEGSLNPGYIKGYIPGVRENGGQYTHAAIWTIIAYAMLGDGDKVGELFALLNPINHAGTRAGLHKYKVEPYVTAGDVYSEPKHIGRGAGPGTRVRPAGCTEPRLNQCSAFICKVKR